MKNMKKALALALASMMLLLLFAGCGSKTETSPEPATETKNVTEETKTETVETGKRTKVTVGMSDNVGSLTPCAKLNFYSVAILGEVFEHLGEYVGTEFTGVLMKNWVAEDDVTYQIELYDYIFDSEGNPFTSEDVKYSVEKLNATGVAQATYVESVDVIDATHFTLKLSKSGVGVFEEFCQHCWMFTQEAMEASPDDMATAPVGTGPYVLTDFVSASHANLEKRDDYWQKEELTPRCSQANVDVIECVILKEATQMAVALQNGTIQIGFWLNNSIIDQVSSMPNVVTNSSPILGMRSMIFNCSENSIFGGENGKLLRQAVCYAINEQAVVDAGLGGFGTVAKTFGKAGTAGYNEAWEDGDYYSYNPEKAKELMAEAGYPDGFSFKFWSIDNSWSRNYMQVVQANCGAIGITVELEFKPDNVNAKILADCKSGWDVYNNSAAGGTGFQVSQFNYFCDATMRSSGLNLCGLNDAKLQSLVSAASALTWTQEDVDAYHDYIVDNALIYTPFESTSAEAHVAEIEDVYINWRKDLRIGCSIFSEDYAYYAD